MKACLLLIAILSSLAMENVSAAETGTSMAAAPARMVIIGDSTVCNYPTNQVRRGWGMFIQNYFIMRELPVVEPALTQYEKAP